MRRLLIAALLFAPLHALGQAQGWRSNQDGSNFACYDVSSFSANNLTSGGTCVAVPGTGQIVIGGAAPTAAWSLTGAMVYAVDPINGSDSNACGAFSVDQTAANIAAATVAAGAVACQTYTGLATKIPPLLNNRTYYGVAAKGTYADNMSALNGISGGTQIWRGTGTDGTAGATAFSGSTADLIDEGAQTCAGANAAGYHPATSGTSSTIQLVKVAGGSPSFGAEPAKPLYCRSRGDVSTGSAGLRNAVNSVIQVIGSDTIVLDAAVTFTTSDTIYLEEPGVIQTGTISLVGNNGTTVISGVQTTNGINTSQGGYLFSFTQTTSWSSAFDRTVLTFTSVDFPTTPTIGPNRVGSSLSVSGGSTSFSQASMGVVGSLSATNPSQFNFTDWNVVGGPATISGGSGTTNTTFGGSANPARVLGLLTLSAAKASIASVNLPSTTQAFGVKVSDKCDLNIFGLITGGLKTNAGWDMSVSARSTILWNLNDMSTVTGANGDLSYGNYSMPDSQNVYLDYAGIINIPGTLEVPNGDRYIYNISGAAGDVYTATMAYNRGDPPGTGPTIVPRNVVVFNFTDGSGVRLAQADTAAHMQGALGVSVSTIPISGAGFVLGHGSSIPMLQESGGCHGHPVTSGWQPTYVSAATAGMYTCTKPDLARQIGWNMAENQTSFFPDNNFMPISQISLNGTNEPQEIGLNFSSEFGYSDNPGASRGDVSISSIAVAKIVGPTGGGTQCLQTSNTGVVTGTGTACGTGSGGVLSVTGTATRVSATPTTGAVVVDTIGGYSTGAVTGGNVSMGSFASGVDEQTTTAGVAAPFTYACTATDVQFGAASGGGLAQSNQLTYDGNTLVSNTASTTVPAAVFTSLATSAQAVVIHSPNSSNAPTVNTGTLRIDQTGTDQPGVVFTKGATLTGAFRFNNGGPAEIYNSGGVMATRSVGSNSQAYGYFGGLGLMLPGVNTPTGASNGVLEINSGSNQTGIALSRAGSGSLQDILRGNSGGTGSVTLQIGTSENDSMCLVTNHTPGGTNGRQLCINGAGQVQFPVGDLLPTAIVAPGTPSTGTAHVYIDSTSKNLAVINDAGTVNHGTQTKANAAGVALTAIADDGSWTTQSFTVPGTAVTCSQLPALTGSDGIATAGATCTVTNAYKGKVLVTGSDVTPDFLGSKVTSPTGTIAVSTPSVGTMLGLDAKLTKHDYFIQIPSLQAVDTANRFLATSFYTPQLTGLSGELPNDFVAGNIAIKLYLIASTGTATTYRCWSTLNGSVITGTQFTFTPGTTSPGVMAITAQPTGSASASDTFGEECVYDGNFVTGPFGATIAFSIQQVLSP